MTCNHHLERDESIDSIKWYKDGKEFYRNVFSTSNDRDRVISYNISGTNSLDPQLSGVSYRNIVIIRNFMLTNISMNTFLTRFTITIPKKLIGDHFWNYLKTPIQVIVIN